MIDFPSLVDRILRQQNAEREAADKARRELMEKATKNTLVSNSDTTTQDTHTMTSSAPTGSVMAPTPPSTGLEGQASKPPTSLIETPGLAPTQVGKNSMGVMNELGRLLGQNAGTSKRDESPPPYQAMPGGVSQPGPSMRLVRSPLPGSTVTPLSNIGTLYKSDTIKFHLMLRPQLANNIDMAIRACTPERNNLLRNREEMQIVKESLDEGYCDVSGRAGDLDCVGTCSRLLYDYLVRLRLLNTGSMGGVKVFATEGTISSSASVIKH
jgi:hypothetical protein